MNKDHFEGLGQPRRPWLEPEALREAFQRRAASLHPDTAATGDSGAFAALNRAHSVLREHASRVRYLLDLEHSTPGEPSRTVPDTLSDTFMELAAARHRLEKFLQQ